MGSEQDALGVTLEALVGWLRRAMPPAAWSSVALSTLNLLVRNGPLRLTELVAAERISQPGMTGLLNRMAAAGLVTRRSDPTDGRATLVSATPQGRAYLAGIHRDRARTVSEHVARLGPEHQQALHRAVAAMAALTDLPHEREGADR